MQTTSSLVRSFQFHMQAAETCLSQARAFERGGDLWQAEDAHADVQWHITQAQLAVDLLAAKPVSLARDLSWVPAA